jgi:hypothetical protein
MHSAFGAADLLLLPSAALFNVMLTFWGSLAFALLAARFAPSHTARKFVLLLPFAKLGYELFAGIPADNYALGPFAGTRWELGRFQLGVDWPAGHVPAVVLKLGALRADRWHSLSGGDLLAHAVYYRGAWLVLAALIALVASIAATRLARRFAAWRCFARALPRGVRGLHVGRVIVRRSLARHGAFTTGVLAPTVWLPRRGDGFRLAEIRAVLRHELAHASRGDVALFALVSVLSDVLWFVPGIGLLARRIHEAAEHAADAAAVRRGADPAALASALVTAAEQRLAGGAFARVAGAGATARRVRALLAPEASLSRWRLALFALLSAGVALIAMRSSFFGFR